MTRIIPQVDVFSVLLFASICSVFCEWLNPSWPGLLRLSQLWLSCVKNKGLSPCSEVFLDNTCPDYSAPHPGIGEAKPREAVCLGHPLGSALSDTKFSMETLVWETVVLHTGIKTNVYRGSCVNLVGINIKIQTPSFSLQDLGPTHFQEIPPCSFWR